MDGRSIEDLEALRQRLKVQYGRTKQKLENLISERYNEIVDVSQLLNSSEYFQPLKAGLSLLKSAASRSSIFEIGYRSGEDTLNDTEFNLRQVETALKLRLLVDSPHQICIALEECDFYRAALWIKIASSLSSSLSSQTYLNSQVNLKEIFPCVFTQCQIIASLKNKLVRRAFNIMEYTQRLDREALERKYLLVYEVYEGKETLTEGSDVVYEEKFYEIISNTVASLLLINDCTLEDVLTRFYNRKLKNISNVLNDISSGSKSLLNMENHYIFTSIIYEAIEVSINVSMKAYSVLDDLSARYTGSNALETARKLYSKNTPPSQLFGCASQEFNNEIFMTKKSNVVHKSDQNVEDILISKFLESTVEVFKEALSKILIKLTPKDFILFVEKSINDYFNKGHCNSLIFNKPNEISLKIKQLIVQFWTLNYPPLYKWCADEIIKLHYSNLFRESMHTINLYVENYDENETYYPNSFLHYQQETSEDNKNQHRKTLIQMIDEMTLNCRELCSHLISPIFHIELYERCFLGTKLAHISLNSLTEMFNGMATVSDLGAIEILKSIIDHLESLLSSKDRGEIRDMTVSLRTTHDIYNELENASSVFVPRVKDKTSEIFFDTVKSRVKLLMQKTEDTWADYISEKLSSGVFGNLEHLLTEESSGIPLRECHSIQKFEVFRPITESFMNLAYDWYKLENLGFENHMVNNTMEKLKRSFIKCAGNFVIEHETLMNSFNAQNILFNLVYIFIILGFDLEYPDLSLVYKKLATISGCDDINQIETLLNYIYHTAKTDAMDSYLLIGPIGSLFMANEKLITKKPLIRYESLDTQRILNIQQLDIVDVHLTPHEIPANDAITLIISKFDHSLDFTDNNHTVLELEKVNLNLKELVNSYRMGNASTTYSSKKQHQSNTNQIPDNTKSKSNSILTNATHFLTDMFKNNNLM